MRNLTSATSAVCSSLSAMLTHPGILSSFESQRLTEDSTTATLWKNASSTFPAYTDVLIELFSLSHLLPVSSRVHWSVLFKLDIVFRSSGLGTTGRRSVVYGRAYIDEEFAQRAAALEPLF